MPIKDMMLVILNHTETRHDVLRDMLEADVAVLLGTVGMIVVAKVHPDADKKILVLAGAVTWLMAAAVLLRPATSAMRAKRGLVLPASHASYKRSAGGH